MTRRPVPVVGVFACVDPLAADHLSIRVRSFESLKPPAILLQDEWLRGGWSLDALSLAVGRHWCWPCSTHRRSIVQACDCVQACDWLAAPYQGWSLLNPGSPALGSIGKRLSLTNAAASWYQRETEPQSVRSSVGSVAATTLSQHAVNELPELLFLQSSVEGPSSQQPVIQRPVIQRPPALKYCSLSLSCWCRWRCSWAFCCEMN